MKFSTRLFSWRPDGLSVPSAFSLGAAGRVSPSPVAVNSLVEPPAWRAAPTAFARSSESVWLE